MLVEEFNCFKVSEKWLDVFLEFILISLHLKFTVSVIGKTATPLSDIKSGFTITQVSFSGIIMPRAYIKLFHAQLG